MSSVAARQTQRERAARDCQSAVPHLAETNANGHWRLNFVELSWAADTTSAALRANRLQLLHQNDAKLASSKAAQKGPNLNQGFTRHSPGAE